MSGDSDPSLDNFYDDEEEEGEGVGEELDLSSTSVSQAWRKVSNRPPSTQREKGLSPEPLSWNQQNQSPQEGSRSQSPQPKPPGTPCSDGKRMEPAPRELLIRQRNCEHRPQETPVRAGSPYPYGALISFHRAGHSCSLEGLASGSCLLFTKAVVLSPRDYRLLANRSFCHKQLGQPGWALGDARVALNLRPQWPRGLFQLGKALEDLQRFKEVADVFRETLAMDKSQPDAVQELLQLILEPLAKPRGQSSMCGLPLSPI